MNMIRQAVFVCLAAGLAAGAVVAEEKSVKGKYQAIEVARFDIKPGVEKFSPDWLVTMNEELIKQLQETAKFKEVLREGEKPSDASTPTLMLVGTVTEYNPGNRAARYMVGFGAGKTKVKAHVKILDKATNEVLFEDDVDGKVIMGVIGGESIGATRGLAKEVASKTKKKFF
jgi:curli biogenesis system outer membrane secretion channel CsgG